jgi:hypothetical protein
VKRRDGSRHILARDGATNVTHVRPLADPPPLALNRVLRLLAWSAELARVGLIDDPRFLALLTVYERAVLTYLEARP